MSTNLRRAAWTAIAVLAAAGVAWIWLREHERDVAAWKRIEEAAARFAELVPHGTIPHAPLLGAPRPGEAIAQYLRAGALLKTVVSDEQLSELYEWSAESQGQSGPEVAAVLASLQPMLDAVTAGAAADTLRVQTFAETLGVGGPMLERAHSVWFGLGPIGAGGALAIRAAIANGDARRAIDLTAAFLTMACDQLTLGWAIYDLLGAGCMSALMRHWTDEALRGLPRDRLRELADVLAAADARCPLPTAVAPRAFLELAWAARSDPPLVSVSPIEIEKVVGVLDGLPATAASGWTERERALTDAVAKLDSVRFARVDDIERARRESLTQLRLLRLAAAQHLGEPLPALRDPLGDGDLDVVRAETGLVLRSAGQSDGKRIERQVAR